MDGINKISVVNIPLKSRRLPYTYVHIAVDDIPVPAYINYQIRSSETQWLFDGIIRGDEGAEGLAAAWTRCLDADFYDYFMSELLDSHKDMTIPILVCDDDLDFSCTTITADVRFDGDFVYWDKIGLVRFKKVREHDKFGYFRGFEISEETEDNIPDEIPDIFGDKHQNIMLHKLRYEYFPSWQEPDNIVTISDPGWKFDRERYDRIIKFFRSVNFYDANIPNYLR